MTAEVVRRLLHACCTVFSPYSTDPRMLKQATGLLDRTAIIDSSASLADANAMACLGLALNEPERAAAVLDAAEKLESVSPTAPTTSWMYHNLRGSPHPARIRPGRDECVPEGSRRAGQQWRGRFGRGHRALVTSHVYHNLGCCQAFVASDTDSAVTTWRTALDLLRQSKAGDDDAWSTQTNVAASKSVRQSCCAMLDRSKSTHLILT